MFDKGGKHVSWLVQFNNIREGNAPHKGVLIGTIENCPENWAILNGLMEEDLHTLLGGLKPFTLGPPPQDPPPLDDWTDDAPADLGVVAAAWARDGAPPSAPPAPVLPPPPPPGGKKRAPYRKKAIARRSRAKPKQSKRAKATKRRKAIPEEGKAPVAIVVVGGQADPEQEEAPELFCVCNTEWEDGVGYFVCDGCNGYFHPDCVTTSAVEQAAIKAAATWACNGCVATARTEDPALLECSKKFAASSLTEGDLQQSEKATANKAASASCPCCRTLPRGPREQRQQNRTLLPHMVMTLDLKCTNTVMGLQACGCLYFCAWCKCSKRNLVAGCPHIGEGVLTPEHTLAWDEGEERHLEYHKVYPTRVWAPLTRQWEPRETAAMRVTAAFNEQQKEMLGREVTLSQICTPIPRDYFAVKSQLAPPAMHAGMGTGNKTDDMRHKKVVCMDCLLKARFLEALPGTEAARKFYDALEDRWYLEEPCASAFRLYRKLRRGTAGLNDVERAEYLTLVQERGMHTVQMETYEEGMKLVATVVDKNEQQTMKAALKTVKDLAQTGIAECDKRLGFLKPASADEKALLGLLAGLPGPHQRALDRAEATSIPPIHRQPFHGCSLNGPNNNNMTKNRAHICKSMAAMRVCNENQTLTEWSGDNAWVQKMLGLMNKLADFCALFSRNEPLCRHEVEMLGRMGTDLGMYWPLSFPTESVTYKMHLMIVHIPAYARENAWLGRHAGTDTEQGVESLHKDVARVFGRHGQQSTSKRESGMFADIQVLLRLVAMGLCTPKPRICPACDKANSKHKYEKHCVCDKTTPVLASDE